MMGMNIPKDKCITKDKLSKLLEEAVIWAEYGGTILQHIHGRITMFRREVLKDLKGKDYNDYIMCEMSHAEELPKYMEAMQETANRYRELADLWDEMGFDEKIAFIRYNMRRVLDVEGSEEGTVKTAKSYTS